MYVKLNDKIYVDEVEYLIPNDIVCDSVSFYYNAKGNMSKALSLHCQNASSQMKLVFQVGAGRFVLKRVMVFIRRCLICVFVILICASLLLNGVYTLYFQRNLKIDEKIEKKWFYSD